MLYRNIASKVSLNLRLFFITTFGILVTMLVVLSFSYRSFSRMIENRFQEKVSFVFKQMVSSTVLPLVFRDQKALERLAKLVLQEEEIVAVKITDALGKEIVSLGNFSSSEKCLSKPVTSKTSEEEGLVFSTDINPSKILGSVTLCYSTRSLRKRMRALLLKSLLVGLFLAFIIDIALYFLVSRAITRPLSQLVRRVRSVQGGELAFIPFEVSLPEVRELSEAFADMVSSLAHSQRALAESYEEMLRHRTLAEVGRLSLLIAHEIKNPLGIIQGALDILRKEEISPELKVRMLAYIEEEVKRLNDLVQHFLAFAKPKKLSFSTLNLYTVLTAMAEKTRLRYPDREIRLDLPQELIIKGDEHWLERAFTNIVYNAFEAGARSVWISGKQTKEGVVLSFADDGPGIPPEKKGEIFKPFFTEKIKGGVGLGLAVVDQIVRLHGGKIQIIDAPQGGALFKIFFPFSKTLYSQTKDGQKNGNNHSAQDQSKEKNC